MGLIAYHSNEGDHPAGLFFPALQERGAALGKTRVTGAATVLDQRAAGLAGLAGRAVLARAGAAAKVRSIGGRL